MKDFLKSLFGRRVLIPIAIIGLLGVFLALYYLVYMPKEQGTFNKNAFRLLGHISDNFRDRIDNYSTSIVTADIQKQYDHRVLFNTNDRLNAALLKQVRQPVIGDVRRDSLYATRKLLRNDSIIFSIRSRHMPRQNDTGKTIKEILDPIIRIRNNIFESVILVSGNTSKESTTDTSVGNNNEPVPEKPTNGAAKTLLYNSGRLAIDQHIIIDSLLHNTGGFLTPVIKELTVEGLRYKLFLYPFRLDNHRYMLGGFISNQDYKSQSQDFPLKYLFIIGLLIILALLSLPFLKIFLIGSGENITIKDVRAIIAMLFIMPFLFVLLLSSLWIYKTEGSSSTAVLKKLHHDVTGSFTGEIATCLSQLTLYERSYAMPDEALQDHLEARIERSHSIQPDTGNINLRNLFFFPTCYMNMDGVFWINNRGVEIEKWNLVKIISPYLYLSERQYYRNIKSGTLSTLPVRIQPAFGNGHQGKDIMHVGFSMQPTLSKATGNYTVNIVKPTSFQFDDSRPDSKAILIGISAKMYSVYKPVLPKGYNFCIVNTSGDILFHSESDRGLQENLFEECGNDQTLKDAVMNRDSALLETALYQREVKAFITPIDGLPYQLVTYYNKRNDYLFNIHIIAFSFFTESLILLGLSLFILLFYYITRKPSRLYFSPEQFDWIKPGHQKIRFYKTLIYFQLILLAAVATSVMMIPAEQRVNFIMQASLLVPFTIATGYYMFRSAEALARKRRQRLLLQVVEHRKKKLPMASNERWWEELPFKVFSARIIKILLAYFSVLVLFSVLKTNIEERSAVSSDATVNIFVGFIFICIPVATAIAATRKYYFLTQESPPVGNKYNKYLRYLGIALMLSAFLISILPALGLVLFAYEQEIALKTKSGQMHLAKQIQAHRLYVNDKVAATKSDLPDHFLKKETEDYVRNLKFNRKYGIYLAEHRLHPVTVFPNVPGDDKHYNSTVYRQVTDYLFLPSDHFDFYNNTNDYFWTSAPNGRNADSIRMDSLTLHYANLNDPRNAESILISADIPHTLPLIRKLEWNELLLFLLMLSVFFLFMYSMFLSMAKRVFLIGYFEGKSVKQQDTSFINSKLEQQTLNEFERKFWVYPVLSLRIITDKEDECHPSHKDYAEWVLTIQTMLAPSYEKIWKSLDLAERSVLYDFALDGFTNYRNIGILFSLYKKSLIKKQKNHLRIMTDSFRNYLIGKSGTAEIRELQHLVSEGGKWGNLRAVFYIVLFAIVLFLFITREDVSKRVLTIVTALAAIIPLLLKLFDPFSPSKPNEK
jgi:hypothetical protein